MKPSQVAALLKAARAVSRTYGSTSKILQPIKAKEQTAAANSSVYGKQAAVC